MIADRNREYGGIGPDAHAIAELGLAPEVPFRRRSPRSECIINKHRPMRNEAIVPDRDELTDE